MIDFCCIFFECRNTVYPSTVIIKPYKGIMHWTVNPNNTIMEQPNNTPNNCTELPPSSSSSSITRYGASKEEHFEGVVPSHLITALELEIPDHPSISTGKRDTVFCSIHADTELATPYRDTTGKIRKPLKFPESVRALLSWVNEIFGTRHKVQFNCGFINVLPAAGKRGRVAQQQQHRYADLMFGESNEDLVVLNVIIDYQVPQEEEALAQRLGPITHVYVMTNPKQSSVPTQPHPQAGFGRIDITFRVDKILCKHNTFHDSSVIKVGSLQSALERYHSHLVRGIDYQSNSLQQPPMMGVILAFYYKLQTLLAAHEIVELGCWCLDSGHKHPPRPWDKMTCHVQVLLNVMSIEMSLPLDYHRIRIVSVRIEVLRDRGFVANDYRADTDERKTAALRKWLECPNHIYMARQSFRWIPVPSHPLSNVYKVHAK